ncbi:class I SAM-dependent methyltransferase [Sungkyunkwania multivorans]|uniref:Class I SAM-dependent methyltransferase n=1 Tax=Sungkyunkwania multivorans TaxID=1173618 RepID=A0ABW3CUM5_9FLAO
MEDLSKAIENHYLKEGLFEVIVGKLKEQGIDIENVTRANILGVDEFHVRGAAVSKELAGLIDLHGKNVLDVGCGLGGPCRMLSDEFDCQTTGIDLSKEYIRTANQLSKLVKLDKKTTFVHGNALDLPFKDSSFDVVWTQHVQMNIPNKERFYSEIFRVLKHGGHLLYYDIFTSAKGNISYPMPWASNANQSFLFTFAQMEKLLNQLGVVKVNAIDQTKAGIDFFEIMMVNLQEFGPPSIGLNLLMGETTKPKLSNLLSHLKDGLLALHSGVYRKNLY